MALFLLSLLSLVSGIFPKMDISREEAIHFLASIEDNVSTHLTDLTFESQTQGEEDWFVYFYDKSCSACRMFKATWRFFAKSVYEDETLNLKVGKLDIEESPDTTRRFRLYKFPTLLYFHKGKYYEITDRRDEFFFYELVKDKGWKNYPERDVPPEQSIKYIFF